jgi:hypothetical protein
MKAEAELMHAYHEWHRLAIAEGKAIQSRNWNLLNDCQLAIKDYQSVVAGLTLEARSEWQQQGLNRREKEQNIHILVNGLIALTRQNQNMLELARAAAQERLAGVSESRRKLKLLKRSYQFGQDPGWSCVS